MVSDEKLAVNLTEVSLYVTSLAAFKVFFLVPQPFHDNISWCESL